jgi:hypothetical protein
MQQIGPNTAVLPAKGPLPPPAEIKVFSAISITPQYFRTAGMRILEGREFNDGDRVSSPLVAVVNQEFARQFFKGDVLDKRIRTNIGATGIGQYNTRTIVAVAQDVRYNAAEGSIQPVIYLPIDQLPPLNIAILLRTTVEPGSLSSAVRRRCRFRSSATSVRCSEHGEQAQTTHHVHPAPDDSVQSHAE